MKTVTLLEQGTFHHMPDNSYPPVLDGLTVRQALAELRRVNWGDMGGMHPVKLSDGTWLAVWLKKAVGGGELLGSQRAHRFEERDFRAITLRSYTI